MYNKITIVGHLGRDPELTYTQGGKAVAKFSVACDSGRTNQESGQREKVTQWFNVVAWEKLADTCSSYLHKGSKVLIEGRMQSRDFTRQDKTEGTAWEIVASTMVMLDPKNLGQVETGEEGAGAEDGEAVPF